MPQRLKTTLKVLVSLGIAGVFLWAAFREADLRAFWASIQQAAPFWILVSAALLLFANLIRAWRWHLLIAPIAQDLSLWRTFLAIQMGYAANNFLPRAGEVVRAVAVKRDSGISLSALLATVLVERAIDMLALLALFGVVLVAFREEVSGVFPWLEGVGLAATAGSLLLLCFFGLLSAYGDRALAPVERALGRISRPLASRLTHALRAFFEGMQAVRTPASYAGIVASTAVLYGIYLLVLYLPFWSFAFPGRYGLGLDAGLVVMVISTVGIVIPAPGGTGTYHFFCSQSLHRLYGVPLPEALAFATVIHGAAYLTSMLTGGPLLLTLFLRGSGDKPLASAPES